MAKVVTKGNQFAWFCEYRLRKELLLPEEIRIFGESGIRALMGYKVGGR